MSFNDIMKIEKHSVEKELEVMFGRASKEISFLEPFVKETYRYCREYVLDGGKRIRPIALIMAYRGFGGRDIEEIRKQAISVELLHNSTLIHDDFMDEDEERRNKPTVYKRIKDEFIRKYGEQEYGGSLFERKSSRFAVTFAALAGNILYSYGLSCLRDSQAMHTYNKAFKTVNDGQMLDVLFENEAAAENSYFEMIRRKTGALLAASMEIGAILADADEKDRKNISQFGYDIAEAFQLWDDVMDLSKDMNKGHELCSDLKKGKKTLIVLHAFDSLRGEDRAFLEHVFGNSGASEKEVEKAASLLKPSISYVKKIASDKVLEAKKRLSFLNLNEEGKAFFTSLADYMIDRKA